MQTTTRNPRSIVLCALLLLALSSPRRSDAQEAEELSPEVIAAAEHGRDLFDEGRFEEAIEFLTNAYDEFGQPIFLQYIGRCYQEIDQPCEAADNYRRFLEDGEPPEAVREQLIPRLEELDGLCEERRDTAPREPQPIVEDPDDGPPLRFGGSGAVVEPRPSHRGTDIAGFVLLGLGAAAFIPGAVLWILSLEPKGQFRDVTPDEYLGRGQWEGDPPLGDLSGPAEEWQRFSIPGDILAFPGLGLMGVGLIVLLVGRRRSDRGEAALPLTIGRGPGDVGLGLALSWR